LIRHRSCGGKLLGVGLRWPPQHGPPDRSRAEDKSNR
jgi:hypothetical protein